MQPEEKETFIETEPIVLDEILLQMPWPESTNEFLINDVYNSPATNMSELKKVKTEAYVLILLEYLFIQCYINRLSLKNTYVYLMISVTSISRT